MGNIIAASFSVGIDYLAGSLTAMLWEWIFPNYSSSSSRLMSTVEGLLQLGAVTATAPYVLNLITPAGSSRDTTIGLIGLMFFTYMYSPNMRAKLQMAHSNAKDVLLFNSGGFAKIKAEQPPVVKPTTYETKDN